MDRDTEEWRRPWTADQTPGRASDGSGGTATRRVARRVVAPRPGEARPTDAAPAPSTGDRAGLAPSPTWGAGDAGPGSPAGSVRPPDAGPTVEAPPRRRGGLVMTLVAALVGGAVGTGTTLAVVGGETGTTRADVQPENAPVRAPVVVPDADGGPEAINGVVDVAAAVLPSVVRIEVYALAGGERNQIGLGSGVVYRSDGYIVTNDHVVRDGDAFEVQFSDGRVVEADVIGNDRLTDLAVVRVDVEGLPAVNLRETPLDVGEPAVAIGSPFGLDASVTAGIVSAINRNLDVPPDGDEGGFVIPAVIQTDAAINPGNSGGALVDQQGRLIGINTAILTRSGGSQGVGFAIPVNAATDAAEQLITRGFVSHPFLGVSGYDVTREVANRYQEEFGIDLEGGGAVMDSVIPDSGADVGGVEAGDVLVEVGGEPITSMGDVIVSVRGYSPGDTIELVVLREGERLSLEVTLGERPR